MPRKPKADSSGQPSKKKRTTKTRKPTSAAGKARGRKAAAPRPRSAAPRAAATRKPKAVTPPPVDQVLAKTPPESLANAMIAVEAARSKLARNMLLLDLRDRTDFTDYFFICSGTNPRQVQAICDEIDLKMKQAGLRTAHTEGYNHAEWVLLDYVDFVAHIFTEAARQYYDLERLWRTADRIPVGDDTLGAPPATP